MSSDRTVLEHLLDGRDALVLEVTRLTTAIEELDSVIARIGGALTATSGGAPALASPNTDQSVKSPDEVESPAPTAGAPATRGPAKSAGKKAAARPRKAAPAKRSAARETSGAQIGQKSIRVHVLEMLAAEDRDFGLAEIIDRIHGEGIQAHDDAVRSITIKLMKDGRVERVGRGLYRLTRRGSSGATTPSAPALEQAPAAPAANYVPPLNLSQEWDRP